MFYLSIYLSQCNELLVLSFSLLSWCSVHLFSLPLPWCVLLDGVGSSFPNGRWSKSSIPTHPLSPEHSLPRTPLRKREKEGLTDTHRDREEGKQRHSGRQQGERRERCWLMVFFKMRRLTWQNIHRGYSVQAHNTETERFIISALTAAATHV